MGQYKTIQCNLAEHGSQILEILNDAIENSTALYDYHPRPPESMVTWFANKIAGNFPVIGLVDSENRLMAFASFGTFRAFPAYKYTVEHSIYVHKYFRGQGLGKVLLAEIIAAAKQRELHSLIGGIDAKNKASIALHENAGFIHCGTLPQVGYKFGDWLDLAFYQLVLETPTHPKDG